MPRALWEERGSAEGTVHFVTKGGRVVGGPLVRSMARTRLTRLGYTPSQINGIIARTIGRPEWIGYRNGMLPSAVAREVVEWADHMGGDV